ncbi:MAG: hypothetical protein OEM05_03100 [Myxococcales bacterium]|nr:hypothetical protein [Myxococcales bacterium]
MATPIAPSDAERAALGALGYTEDWLRAGLLGRALLAEQYERLLAGGTKKTARYRAQALAAWRDATGAISDEALDAYLAVAAADPDKKLAASAVADLIQCPRITLEQLERIANSDPKLMKRHEALIRRTYLTRRLDQGVTGALIEQVIALKEASVQTRLIRDERLSREQAEALAKGGANPTIREQAQAWVQDKKAWK